MANSAKSKGDRAEREAVELLKTLLPDVVNHGAKRELGAGRKEDIGDIVRVVPETVIQVKSYAASAMATGLRTAAVGSAMQLENAIAQGYPMRFSVGLVPIPGAGKNGAVRWLATCTNWPVELPLRLIEHGGPVRFTSAAKLTAWMRDDMGPHGYMAFPRTERIATHGLSLTDTVLVAPIEAWIAAYREATGTHVPDSVFEDDLVDFDD
jgi:hypothetical protein